MHQRRNSCETPPSTCGRGRSNGSRPEQRELIDQAARLLGKNRSDFMLEAACDRAQSVILDQVFFSLKADKFRQFTKLLDAPPAQNPGLERLMAVKAPWGNKSAKT